MIGFRMINFRAKLFLAFTVTVAGTVAFVTSVISSRTTQAFEKLDAQRTAALLDQFRKEFQRRGEEVTRRVDGVAHSPLIERMTVELSRPLPEGAAADFSPYVAEAQPLAASHGLDFLELIAPDFSIISSAQHPARFGYREELVAQPINWASQPAFLRREELPDDSALSLTAVRALQLGDRTFYIVGGQRLDQAFLSSIVLPAGMEVTLSTKPDASPQSIPLRGRDGNVLATLVVANSHADQLALERYIRNTGFMVAAAAIALGLLLAWWATTRVTRPVRSLVEGAREVAAGNWNARVDVSTGDEIGELGAAFNRMTAELTSQRERLLQSERVAAWRELARRLAHELKNPLFPLQITVENLRRARSQAPHMFDEVFEESTVALLDELGQLKRIVAEFSDFSKMPPPRFEPVNVNEIVRNSARLFESQTTIELSLDSEPPRIQADPQQLSRVLQNLMLNAIDAMPNGGKITLSTRAHDDAVEIGVADTGGGLTKEECERLFTPYYTTKQHGTGLGLAIVQSIVADHHGKIRVESQPGQGAAFHIELPCGNQHNGSPADR